MESTQLIVCRPDCLTSPIHVPKKLLLGPGPSNVSERVLKAMTNPLLGHLHPEFLKIMDDVKEGLQYLFQTESRYVFCISGTGHGGLDALMINLIEPEDVILIAKNGMWGERAAIMASRQDGDVRLLETSPGKAFSLEDIEEALMKHRPSVFFIVHVESTTGVLQPLEGIGELCKKYGALLAVDTVASLGGIPFLMDQWGVDVAYTGSQKVLSCPPSLAPVAVGHKAMAKVVGRKVPPRSFYFDYLHLANYWGCDDEPRRYHHTGPISSVYALREGLAQLAEEGLENLWERHSCCAQRLQEGLLGLGLDLFVRNRLWRAPTITTIQVPSTIHWKSITDELMEKFSVEISGGMGPTANKIWRIGLLGQNCTVENVDFMLKLLTEVLSTKILLRNKL